MTQAPHTVPTTTPASNATPTFNAASTSNATSTSHPTSNAASTLNPTSTANATSHSTSHSTASLPLEGATRTLHFDWPYTPIDSYVKDQTGAEVYRISHTGSGSHTHIIFERTGGHKIAEFKGHLLHADELELNLTGTPTTMKLKKFLEKGQTTFHDSSSGASYTWNTVSRKDTLDEQVLQLVPHGTDAVGTHATHGTEALGTTVPHGTDAVGTHATHSTDAVGAPVLAQFTRRFGTTRFEPTLAVTSRGEEILDLAVISLTLYLEHHPSPGGIQKVMPASGTTSTLHPGGGAAPGGIL